MKTLNTGTGRCSCLKYSDFRVGQRIEVVHFQPNQYWLEIGDVGVIREIQINRYGFSSLNAMYIRLDRSDNTFWCYPQNIRPIKQSVQPNQQTIIMLDELVAAII